ncbi:hypothetical protein L0128_16255, partial [candidate division KSB1 bacterium]|nr:hypothetical protein [candidate division KSB1 bacterium]
FTPQAIGPLSDTLIIHSNDDPLKISLSGVGAAGKAELIQVFTNYPNPIRDRGFGTIMVYLLSQPATVKIHIYNLAGELVTAVTDLAGQKSWAGPEGKEDKIIWYGKDFAGHDLANGIYIGELIVVTGGKEERRYRKIAILTE